MSVSVNVSWHVVCHVSRYAMSCCMPCLSCACESMSIAHAPCAIAACTAHLESQEGTDSETSRHRDIETSREAARERWYKRDHASFKGICRRRQQPTPKTVCTTGGSATDACQSVTASLSSCVGMSQHVAACCVFACHKMWPRMSYPRACLVCVHDSTVLSV